MRKTAKITKPVFTQIWFLIEGRSERWRCACHAGWFRIGDEHEGQTILVCTYGKLHRVLNGFFLEPPVPIEEPAVQWVGKLIRGVQLKLPFRGHALEIQTKGG